MTDIVKDGLTEPTPTERPTHIPTVPEAATLETAPQTTSRVGLAFWSRLALDLFLIALIVCGVYFRFSWTNWNQNTDLHPDEYGLTATLTRLAIPATFGDYINTRLSSISPYQKYDADGLPTEPGPDNRMRWGQWPIVLIRLAAELTDNTGYIEMRLMGRQMSALADVLALLLTYLIGLRLYGHRVGLIGSALSALAVMQIQQSHFMTSDNFALLFTMLAMYCAVQVAVPGAARGNWAGGAGWYALFGVFLGMALASRINLAPLAAEIVIAAVIANSHSLLHERNDTAFTAGLSKVVGLLALAGLCVLLTFRVTHPMSFRAESGDTTVLTVTPNPEWLASLQVAQAESSGVGGGPPGEQWTNRPALIFPFTNMVLWGMGLPLGLAGWAGLLWAARRLLQGKDWQQHLLPLTWAGGYFVFMGTRWVKSMRYFLPIYPFMALFAAWALVELWKLGQKAFAAEHSTGLAPRLPAAAWRTASILLGAVVLLGTLTWAYGFTSIYRTENTRIQASRWIYANVAAPISLRLVTDAGEYNEPVPFTASMQVLSDYAIPVPFTAHATGTLSQVSIGHARNTFGIEQPVTLQIALALDPNGAQPLARTQVVINPSATDFRGGTGVAQLGPAPIIEGQTYYLLLQSTQGGPATLTGSTIANENWDEGLPLRIEGRDGFGGLYSGRTMEVRWSDDENKRAMFYTVLSETDYIVLPSQRGIWSTSRLPANYPMTLAYYRALFDGRLGFDLVASFQSPIIIGPLRISDVGGTWAWDAAPQLPLFNDNPLAAEEAFSVYDHAPVWIFKKRPDFDIDRAMAILFAIDLESVVVQGPREATAAPTLLMLPDDRLAEQRAGGTWSDMFSRDWILNRYEPLGAAAWWVSCALLGLMAFPILFVALHGLPDRGYALSRNLALLVLAWASWLLGSLRLMPFTQMTLWLVAGAMALASGFILWRRGGEIGAWFKANGRYVASVEALSVVFFLFFLFVRWGNGDLWHPNYGGEKPMDFSYFNAVLKSTSFPPYDPWFAGGYLNYYYFGFVIVATLTKMLGIVPAFAYNLILPLLFSLAGMGAFSVAYNLVAAGRRQAAESLPTRQSLQRIVANPYGAGLLAACLFVVLGNLGQWNTVMKALTRVAPDVRPLTPLGFITDLQKIATGFWRIYIERWPVPVGTGEWYWNATRVIPDSQTVPITEFPFFTFLYADLHAHMIVLIITVIALAWCLSLVLAAGAPRRGLESFSGWVLAGIAFGAIQPSNLSDYQTFWALGCVAITYAELRRHGAFDLETLKRIGLWCGLLIGLSILFYWPYLDWRGEGYGSVELWKGDKTPLNAYWTVHGVFLAVCLVYLLTETRRWMQRTLVDDVKDLAGPAIFAAVAFSLMIFGLWWLRYDIVLIALPLIIWTGLLLVQKRAEPERRAVLGLFGLGLTLTVVVEVVVARGDIGRMNTVFKFYLQVWTFFSIAAGAALAWIWAQMPEWRGLSRGLVQLGLTSLFTVAALYTVLATAAKVQDRMAPAAPRTLDGMLYMNYSQYPDQGETIDLKWDYDAILWMQENVAGSPVIVEVNAPEYRWGSRYTINTGLPGVLGWNWHQRQQRIVVPDRLIWSRSNDISAFYITFSEQEALAFLDKYDVEYIVVGEYERLYFPPPSLEKFERMADSGMLEVAYQNEGVSLYRVERPRAATADFGP